MKEKHIKEKEILDEFRQYGKVEKLVQEYWNLVFTVVQKTLQFYRINFTKEDVEDIRNEVFAQLFINNFRRLRQYNEKKGLSLSGWIKLVANQTTLNEIRKNGMLDMARRNFQIPFENIEEILKYDEENRFEAREDLRLLTEAIERLSERDNCFLKKCYFEWLSLQEIADSAGESYQNTAKMIHDAKKRLKEKIKQIAKEE